MPSEWTAASISEDIVISCGQYIGCWQVRRLILELRRAVYFYRPTALRAYACAVARIVRFPHTEEYDSRPGDSSRSPGALGETAAMLAGTDEPRKCKLRMHDGN